MRLSIIPRPIWLTRLISWGVVLTTFSPIIVLSYLGTNVRYFSDDFLTAAATEKYGLWESQVYWYQAWSGRYSFTFLITFIESLFGLKITTFLPFIGLLFWSASLYFLIYLLFKVNHIQHNTYLVLAAVAIQIISTIISLENFEEFIFWQTGIITYEISVIQLNILLCVVLWFYLNINSINPTFLLVLLSFYVFFMGGFSETWTIVQISIFSILLIYLFFFQQNIETKFRKFLISLNLMGLIISIISIIIIFIAPGNRVRSPKGINISIEKVIFAVEKTLIGVPKYLLHWFTDNTLLAFFLFAFFFALGIIIASKNDMVLKIRNSILILIFSWLILMADFFPEYLVYGYRPWDRIVFPAFNIFIFAYTFFSFVVGMNSFKILKDRALLIQKIFIFLILFVSILVIPVRTTYSLVKYVIPLQTYSQLWDQRDAFIKSEKTKGTENVEVIIFKGRDDLHEIQAKFWIYNDLHESENYWINKAAAKYYGVKSIKVK